MKTKTETRMFFILRFFRTRDKKTLFAYDTGVYSSKRQWWYTEKERRAFRFNDRTDARRSMKAKCFQDDLLHPRSNYGRMEDRPESAYFWEVVKVTETIVTTFQEEIIVSDAPAMVVLGRSAL